MLLTQCCCALQYIMQPAGRSPRSGLKVPRLPG